MTGVELVRWCWVILSAFGLVFTSRNLREAVIDLQALNESPRSAIQVLQIQARGSVWDQALKVIGLASLLATGIVGRQRRRMTQRDTASVTCLLINVLCLVTLSWMQNERRHRISQALRLRSE